MSNTQAPKHHAARPCSGRRSSNRHTHSPLGTHHVCVRGRPHGARKLRLGRPRRARTGPGHRHRHRGGVGGLGAAGGARTVRRRARALTIWTTIAVIVSLGTLPYMPGFTVTERLLLGLVHLSLALLLILGLRRTARARN